MPLIALIINQILYEERLWKEIKSNVALTIVTMYAKIMEVPFLILNQQEFPPQKWACGAAGSALPWHGRGRRFDPDQVHHIFKYLRTSSVPAW